MYLACWPYDLNIRGVWSNLKNLGIYISPNGPRLQKHLEFWKSINNISHKKFSKSCMFLFMAKFYWPLTSVGGQTSENLGSEVWRLLFSTSKSTTYQKFRKFDGRQVSHKKGASSFPLVTEILSLKCNILRILSSVLIIIYKNLNPKSCN